MRRKQILILLMLTFSVGVYSQTLETGVFVGSSYYLGDINPDQHFDRSRPAFGLIARYNINNRWAFRANLLRGNVQAADQLRVAVAPGTRDLLFKSAITEFSVVTEFNFLPYETGSQKMKYTPYIFGGVGFFFFNPKDTDGNSLKNYGTEGQLVNFDGRTPYSSRSLVIPFGIGFKYSLSEKIGVGIEWGMRKTFTDYLDDISTTYYLDATTSPVTDALRASDPTLSHKPYEQRGNPETKDWYCFFGFSITYKFNVIKEVCNNF